ncbi:MAG: DUF3108 domain-containing protein [bacterium]|nr:DUF3108 domain-containing protein [bacterium]
MPKKSILQRILLTAVLFIGLFPMGYFSVVELGIAEASTETDSMEIQPSRPFDRFVDNVAFGVGEKLTFDIKYGFITAGTATMEVLRLIEFENRPCYQIVTRAVSNDFFSSVFRVEDRVESVMDATGLYSWRFEKRLREGNYRSERMYTFDQRNNQVVYREDTIDIAPFVQDALSSLYYIRTQSLEVGQSVFVENFVDGKSFSMEVKVVERERVSIDAGSFDCIVVEPLTQSAGVFKHKGRLKVWLTDDALRMPVLMKSKVIVGSIVAELVDYELGSVDEF